MIIRQANIQLAARHSYQELREVRERLTVRTGAANGQGQNTGPVQVETPLMQAAPPAASAPVLGARQSQTLDLRGAASANERLQLMIIARLYQQITGEELQILTPDQLQAAAASVSLEIPTAPVAPSGPALVYERQTRSTEVEKMHFAAQGQVVTQDGKSISFNAELFMSRSFTNTTSLTLIDGQPVMKDPLVINFDGTGAELERTRFAFDLDSDGTEEQIANLRPNSGYLALDKNGDGVINNGRELFGPTSNNGFAELAAYDEDNNGFIDEGDSVYSQLRIWQRDSNGASRLLALGDRQIGAIYLGHAMSPMQLKAADNTSLGEVVSSGVYLREDGSTGLVQQINLAV
ncbi:MAG TPA: hypothetical protein PK011_14640 [Marinagarivorans sp.]|nr:hypothetical protein [Cellvibrionaceae bacterium]HMY40559.1 hypothetical protein [Marinagarivorans sp.]HNG58774.1 hypothetical protein [Cellvibrionaceae bacterium]